MEGEGDATNHMKITQPVTQSSEQGVYSIGESPRGGEVKSVYLTTKLFICTDFISPPGINFSIEYPLDGGNARSGGGGTAATRGVPLSCVTHFEGREDPKHNFVATNS